MERWAEGIDVDVMAGLDRGLAVARGYAVVFMQSHGGRPPEHVRLWQTIDAIKATVSAAGRKWASGLRAGGDGQAPYAAIQEFGGVTSPHVIVPRNAKVLAFEKGGEMVFARRVNHPGSRIPGLHYLTNAIERARPVIHDEVRRAVLDGFEIRVGHA